MNKPRMYLSDVIAIFLVYAGYLVLYFLMFILMENSVGPIYDDFQMLFQIMSWVLVAALIFGAVGLVIFAARYIVWLTVTPKWERDEQNGKQI